MTQYVICALQMEGFHCWPEADGELAYLKNSHRHIFFITAEFPVRNTPFFYFFTRNAERR